MSSKFMLNFWYREKGLDNVNNINDISPDGVTPRQHALNPATGGLRHHHLPSLPHDASL
jgi:hypothetical protein